MKKQTTPKLKVAQFELVTNIEKTFTDLLPIASKNVGMPFETPLRWFEGYYAGEPDDPYQIALWANLGDDKRKLSLTRYYETKHNPRNFEWIASYDEPSNHPDATRAVTSFVTYTDRDPEIEKTFWTRRSPTLGHVVDGGEYGFTMTEERKLELIGGLATTLAEFSDQTPEAHTQFMEAQGLDIPSRTFERLGSLTAREFVATL